MSKWALGTESNMLFIILKVALFLLVYELVFYVFSLD